MVETVRHALVAPRIAIIFRASHGAAQVSLRRPVGVVRDNQVEKTIVVIIKPGGSDAERVARLGAYSRDLSHVRESPVAIVVIQRIAARGAEKQIFIAVVIVVANRNPEVESQGFP